MAIADPPFPLFALAAGVFYHRDNTPWNSTTGPSAPAETAMSTPQEDGSWQASIHGGDLGREGDASIWYSDGTCMTGFEIRQEHLEYRSTRPPLDPCEHDSILALGQFPRAAGGEFGRTTSTLDPGCVSSPVGRATFISAGRQISLTDSWEELTTRRR